VTFRTRLLLGLAVLVLTAVASSGWLLLTVARVQLQGAQESQARLLGEQISRELLAGLDEKAPLGDPINRTRLDAAATSLMTRGHAREVVVVDEQGRAIVGAAPDDPALAQVSTLFLQRHPKGTFVYVPLATAGRRAGAVRIALDDASDLTAAFRTARSLLFSLMLLDFAAVLLLGTVFIRRVVRPIDALAQTARRVASGELDVPPVPAGDSNDELSRLTDAFNRMTASLREQREHLLAQEKLATVGRLAAGVAHEVGNPLTAVLGYAEMMLADEPAEGPSERRDMLERVRKEIDRIRSIISDLLEYSRPVAGAVEPVRLREAVDSAVALLRPQARFRGVTVDNQVPAELPPASAAGNRITQVLLNLFLNAADAMAGAGRITVEAKAPDGFVLLMVRDSGPGIPLADREKIFDPFFTTKEPGKGTGLGLAICRSIVQAYGGDLTLSKPDGQGALFVVRLPRFAA
jgi:signal transduction histidine kinase